MFTVRSRGVLTQDKSGYFSNSKVYGKNGTGKKCSLIRGVHYERFHCILLRECVCACVLVCMYVRTCVRALCMCVCACMRA